MLGAPWEWVAALDLTFLSPVSCSFTLLFRFDTHLGLLDEMAQATHIGVTVEEPSLLANGEFLCPSVLTSSPCTGITRSRAPVGSRAKIA